MTFTNFYKQRLIATCWQPPCRLAIASFVTRAHLYFQKLIEVALPLDEINAASAREKSIHHDHPNTRDLW